VQLRGEFARFGIDATNANGYSEVMKNRPVCVGAYPDMFWTDFGIFHRASFDSIPQDILGSWLGQGLVAHGVAGDTMQSSCFLDSSQAQTAAGIDLEGIYITRTQKSTMNVKRSGLNYLTAINQGAQRQFVSYNPQTEILVMRDSVSQNVTCALFSTSNPAQAIWIEWTDLRDGAALNPCDRSAYTGILASRQAECQGDAAQNIFFAGSQVLLLQQAAASLPLASWLGLGLASTVLLAIQRTL
jgi:hypothetical protein